MQPERHAKPPMPNDVSEKNRTNGGLGNPPKESIRSKRNSSLKVGDVVTLKKKDGKQVKLQMDQLSDEDQDFINHRRWRSGFESE